MSQSHKMDNLRR